VTGGRDSDTLDDVMHRLGEFELHAVSDGFFRLDGGAMFGIVPKPLWEKVAPPDERNRITLSLTALLVRTGQRNVLVDTGVGTKNDAKFLEMYAVERATTVSQGLAAAGLRPEDVDLVILSHLHFDHAGGATVRREGRLEAAFPKAMYVIQEGMWDEALDPNPRTKGSYFRDDFVPLREQGRVKFVRGDEEVAPGIRVRHTGGHVKHHQIVELESGGRKAVYWADLIPTSHHVKPAWVMGYDLFPHEVAAQKVTLLERSASERWVNVFEHDPKVAMAYITREEKGFRVESIESVPGAR
jgi:glyoxylase-like metal-dependent hydrolase (beta-lactamase superfamily II)